MLLLSFIPMSLQKQLSKVKFVNTFISGDDTVAGSMYEYVLLAYGIFTIVHGLALMHVFKDTWNKSIESKSTQYSVYLVLGVVSLVFYALVLHTNLPISKDRDKYHNYIIYGYLGGLSFIVVPIFWEVLEMTMPSIRRLSVENKLALMTGTSLVLLLVAIVVSTNVGYDKKGWLSGEGWTQFYKMSPASLYEYQYKHTIKPYLHLEHIHGL